MQGMLTTRAYINIYFITTKSLQKPKIQKGAIANQ